MTDGKLFDQAADIIAKVRAESLKLGVGPKELARLFLDGATPTFFLEDPSGKETSLFLIDFVQRRISYRDRILPNRS